MTPRDVCGFAALMRVILMVSPGSTASERRRAFKSPPAVSER
jgi:hypothetical protein